MRRREFLKLSALGSAGLLMSRLGCAGAGRYSGPTRVIAMGVDGMDPGLVERYVAAGLMPNTARLLEGRPPVRLGTSNPPQSPVAWSDFITGADASVHGIFDFIHRDPATMRPFLSTSRVDAPSRSIGIGDHRFPLSGGRAVLLRRGEPFWKPLEEAGVPVALIKLPVDFPPLKGDAAILSGLGTPDMRGSQGSFTYFTDDPLMISDDTSGGLVTAVRDNGNGCYDCRITGPPNTMLADSPLTQIEFRVWRDRDAAAVRIDLPSGKLVLAEGEWSSWQPLSFPLLAGVSSARAIARFHLASVNPHLGLYVSPLNIDPLDPALPISQPDGYSARLARELGRFYTQGFPEDTKALSRGVLDDEGYLEQARIVLRERMKLWERSLRAHSTGFLFFYFSSLDLNVHMFYRTIDERSPLHGRTDLALFGGVIGELYSEVDRAIGMAMECADEHTAIAVFSDHGFAPFRRSFNLNSWLAAEGYARIGSPFSRDRDMFEALDWSGTAAYGLGLNALYLNIRGREKDGTIEAGPEAERVLRDIAQRLEGAVDPQSGLRIVDRLYLASEIYGGPLPDHAPDAIVGYASGFRSSWETALGSFPDAVIEDNLDPWSGTHCVSPSNVPGTLISSVPLGEHAGRGLSLRDVGVLLASGFDPGAGIWA
ncbi:alkaline phosphatase family protein [Candidatus Fermentibacterales bacterium]|nr:alkaline phosphatase family protein [Candidatus Fermentibacterales bacterium]